MAENGRVLIIDRRHQKACKRLMVKGLRLFWIALCSKTSDTPLATSREPRQTRQ